MNKAERVRVTRSSQDPESRAADPAALTQFVLVGGFFSRTRLLHANLPVSPASLTCLFFTVSHFLFFPPHVQYGN